MEIKVTFRFDASDSFLAAAGKFYEAAHAIAGSGLLNTLPDKDRGIVKAVATSEGVTVNKKERIYPPESDDKAAAEPQHTENGKDGTADADAAGGEAGSGAEAEAGGAEAGGAEAGSGEAGGEDAKAGGGDVPSVADMRAAVARCRERIEGADWEDKNSEGYKKWHKKVTQAVKGVLAFLDAEKIPEVSEDKRSAFIASVDNLVVEGDKITSEAPF